MIEQAICSLHPAQTEKHWNIYSTTYSLLTNVFVDIAALTVHLFWNLWKNSFMSLVKHFGKARDSCKKEVVIYWKPSILSSKIIAPFRFFCQFFCFIFYIVYVISNAKLNFLSVDIKINKIKRKLKIWCKVKIREPKKMGCDNFDTEFIYRQVIRNSLWGFHTLIKVFVQSSLLWTDDKIWISVRLRHQRRSKSVFVFGS